MTLAPGTKLGPYEILASIGAGGMGEVWKARDTRLGRIVAIKKVKEQHSERFKQEARSIAALNHPYITQLFDIGPDYLVLEYVEGRPLSSPLPEREVVRLAIQIATALEEAHRNGIIHRDLKPSNIMVTDKGSVKLLDFGLAKLYEQDASISTSPTADYPATQAGAVLGTVAYMSPEQAQGRPADARSDIFSFGLVLYEMLSGRRAFSGDSNYAIVNAIVKDGPPPLKASAPLERIVRRCLVKQPLGRFQTMSEVKAALEQVFVEKPAVTAAEPQPSIAVLPFVNMSGDKEQEYFSDGLAEEIINALTQIPGLKVIARTSAFAFRGKEQDIRQIAEALGVTRIFEGSVRKSGNRIRVTAQLISAADGSHLWSQRYDRELTEVFVIQDEISQAIAEKLRVKLEGKRPLMTRHTESIEAHSLCLKGRYLLLRFTPESGAKSKECFEKAIAADPGYALPWLGMGEFYFLMYSNASMPPKAAHAQSRQAVLKALELDEMLPEAHSLLGMLLACEYDWRGAEREFRRSLELGPQSADILGQYAQCYCIPMRLPEDALAANQKAVELDPLSLILQTHLGIRYFFMRQYARVIEQCHNAIELDSHFPVAYLWLGFACIQVGKFDDGIRAIETAVQLLGSRPPYMGVLGYAYALVGRIGETQKLLEQLKQLAQNTYVHAAAFGFIYFGLGDMDKCFDWLEKTVEEHDSLRLFLAPFYDSLRSHPRYHTLIGILQRSSAPPRRKSIATAQR